MSGPDVISLLTQRRRGLYSRRRELQVRYEREMHEIDVELIQVKQAMDTINRAVVPLFCPTCHGCGQVRRGDAAGDMEDEQCPACGGTGIAAEGQRA